MVDHLDQPGGTRSVEFRKVLDLSNLFNYMFFFDFEAGTAGDVSVSGSLFCIFLSRTGV